MKSIIILFLFLSITLITSCNHEIKEGRNIETNYLEFYYNEPRSFLMYKYNCHELQSGIPVKTRANYLRIDDTIFFKRFMSNFCKLQNDTLNILDIDARIQALVHFNNKVDTLCMGDNFGIKVNNSLKNDDLAFTKMVVLKILKYYNPHVEKNITIINSNGSVIKTNGNLTN